MQVIVGSSDLITMLHWHCGHAAAEGPCPLMCTLKVCAQGAVQWSYTILTRKVTASTPHKLRFAPTQLRGAGMRSTSNSKLGALRIHAKLILAASSSVVRLSKLKRRSSMLGQLRVIVPRAHWRSGWQLPVARSKLQQMVAWRHWQLSERPVRAFAGGPGHQSTARSPSTSHLLVPPRSPVPPTLS